MYKNINGISFKYHPRASAPDTSIEAYTLDGVYERPSHFKRVAFRDCEIMANCLNGFNRGITSYNCQTFTYRFDFAHPETGELMRAVITRDYIHLYHL